MDGSVFRSTERSIRWDVTDNLISSLQTGNIYEQYRGIEQFRSNQAGNFLKVKNERVKSVKLFCVVSEVTKSSVSIKPWTKLTIYDLR